MATINLNLFITPELCKKCIHYKSTDKTCMRSVVALSKSKVFYDFAKAVRHDPKKCGANAIWFQEAEP
jgi:hypothetical protein